MYIARSAGSDSVIAGLQADQSLSVLPPAAWILLALAVDDLDVLGVADDDRPPDAATIP